MSSRSYRLVTIVTALAWLLLGMHMPIVHQIREHGRMPGTNVIVAVSVVVIVAISGLVALLRDGGRGRA